MKKYIFLAVVLSNFLLFGQQYQIELRLVDATVGYPIGNPIPGYTPESNDSGLNDIFAAFDASVYYPGYSYIPEWYDRTHFILCDGCDINAFEQALMNYSSVIENTIQCAPHTMNALYVKLITLDNGTNTGTTTSSGAVITDNDDLNIIFEDFDVLYFEPAFPSGGTQFERTYIAACDCNASELKPLLELETETIELVEGPLGYAILANEEFEALDFQFYPNPVEDKLIINSTEDITSFEVLNLLGRTLFKVSTEEKLNAMISSLSSGPYFLKVTANRGVSETFKLLKK
ncbi:T9SS type A sorting domain-containing protein [Ulvibacter litoralis]|uniref:Por secretion system C-terminal sorting domain-containing protein n=1 Tax=Ulvibacter litoralis TaxID=227084 RepID=A0A1G7HJM2_9FLAO|nr:T9SS type A sorting domain-containing protein [Ulvibacter litoralis]GHC58060.1 hypothetical protein GCM10008083_23400 [Ulvibacter litoralis]SDF00561.1 Por secretion system C-terminal sorting domain-containing protein [Ulvibacter litoralis]